MLGSQNHEIRNSLSKKTYKFFRVQIVIREVNKFYSLMIQNLHNDVIVCDLIFLSFLGKIKVLHKFVSSFEIDNNFFGRHVLKTQHKLPAAADDESEEPPATLSK